MVTKIAKRLNRLARFREGEPPGEPVSQAAWTEPRPPRITKARLEHGYTTKEVFKAVEFRLPPGWTWRHEQPVRIPAYDEPEPDITIVRGSDAAYRHRIPGVTDVGLSVEVSRSNASPDRLRGNRYGSSGIGVYWIVNLLDRQVEAYTDRGPSGYATRTDDASGQQVPVVLDGRQCGQIAVNDVMP
jgi:Uma2 family endonuclease